MDEKAEVTFFAPDGLKLQVTDRSFVFLSSPKPPPNTLGSVLSISTLLRPPGPGDPEREGLGGASEAGSEQYVLQRVSSGGQVLSKQA